MENDSIKRLYEVGYLLIPLIPEDKVVDEVNVFRSHVENAGGFIVSEEQPKMRKLAYDIKQRGLASKKLKFNDAYFGWIRFNASSEEVLAVNDAFDKNDKVLRFIITKTTKDIPRVPRVGASGIKSKGEIIKKDQKVAMSDQELDKEIDQLLVGDKVSV